MQYKKISVLRYQKIKLIFDKLFAFVALIVLSPLFLLISILIITTMGKPVFFIQKRPGLNGKIFKLIKFRTMCVPKSTNKRYLSEKERISKLGAVLRMTSLDELPELINILQGEMSFIGPRPLLVEYLSLYNKEQFMRHHVRPGLSGWAQINGRNNISWDQKFKLDLWYVKNMSFALDLKIFFSTFFYIFKQSKVNQKDDLSMPQFKG